MEVSAPIEGMMNTDQRFVLPGRTKPYVMAHRGNRVICPENTLAAFQQAIQDGADILETDLHLSADGIFVCIHDGTVDRTTNGHGPVAEKTLAELKTLSASYGRDEFGEERIPTLSELGHILPAYAAVGLELKTDRFLEPEVCQQLADELQVLGIRQRAVVLSFSMERLMAVRKAAPDIPTGWITIKKATPQAGVDLLGPFWPLLMANPFYITMAHRRGQVVCPLDPLPDRRLLWYTMLGVDAVLTDHPGKTISKLRKLQRVQIK